jgi:hypothetical protein
VARQASASLWRPFLSDVTREAVLPVTRVTYSDLPNLDEVRRSGSGEADAARPDVAGPVSISERQRTAFGTEASTTHGGQDRWAWQSHSSARHCSLPAIAMRLREGITTHVELAAHQAHVALAQVQRGLSVFVAV